MELTEIGLHQTVKEELRFVKRFLHGGFCFFDLGDEGGELVLQINTREKKLNVIKVFLCNML